MCAYLCLSLSLSFCSSFSLLRRKVNVHTLVDDILAWKMAKDRYIYQAQLFPCFKSWSLELQQISCVILLYKKMRGSKRTNLWMPNAICKHIYNQKGSQGSDRCLQNHLEIFKKLVYLSPFSQNSDQAISLRYRIVYLFKKEKKKSWVSLKHTQNWELLTMQLFHSWRIVLVVCRYITDYPNLGAQHNIHFRSHSLVDQSRHSSTRSFSHLLTRLHSTYGQGCVPFWNSESLPKLLGSRAEFFVIVGWRSPLVTSYPEGPLLLLDTTIPPQMVLPQVYS